jgi:hypothetical protein
VKNVRAGKFVAAVVFCSAILQGCSSAPVNISPLPPAKYEVLGKATGSACGALGIVATAYYAIPMGLNSRVENAYQDALSSVPGATGLINVEISENWFWAAVVTVRCTTIKGDAIKGAA